MDRRGTRIKDMSSDSHTYPIIGERSELLQQSSSAFTKAGVAEGFVALTTFADTILETADVGLAA